MPRNFGLHRDQPEELFRAFWDEPANDNEPELRWPYWVVGAAVLAIIAVGIWVR